MSVHSVESLVCPCCASKGATSGFFTYHGLPEILFPVERRMKDNINRGPLSLVYCSHCHHIYQYPVDRERVSRIYRDLYQFYPYQDLESFYQPYRKPFFEVFDLVFSRVVEKRRLLEIGCASRGSMKRFSERGFACTGVSPSFEKESGDDCDGIMLIEGVYEEISLGESYDVIILRFVLEHVVDLEVFLNKLKGDLKAGGYVFVQVPNALEFDKMGNLCIGAHEHTHYFCKDSVAALFEKEEFERWILVGEGEPSIIGCFGIGETAKRYESHFEFRSKLESARREILEILENFKKIGFYGAGLQLCWILYTSDIDLRSKEIVIVDDNPVLEGRYMPHTEVPIVLFRPEVLRGCDAIVLSLSPIYYKAVLGKLRELGFLDMPIFGFENGHWKER